MTKAARFSYAVLAAVLILVGLLQLGAPFLALLFSYFVLTQLGRFIPNKWAVLAVFLIMLAGITYAAGHFIHAAISALPKIADNAIPAATAWAQERDLELPFTDFESLKATAMASLKDEAHYLGNVANFARHASTTILFLIIGVVAAVSLFFNSQLDLFREHHKIQNNLYSVCCAEITARFSEFYRSFATVIGAQMTISCINTTLTAIFVFAVHLPYGAVVVGLTFLCGLLPIVGNVVSNTVIVFIGFLVSPKVAIGALIFLVVVHKLEYFLNSKIIGARIRNPIWLTLLGLIIGEKLMGIPGMILSPVVLNYLRVEMSKIEASPISVSASGPITGEPVDRARLERTSMSETALQNPWIELAPGIRRRTVTHGETMYQMIAELKAGTKMAEHKHPQEQIIHILSGRMKVFANGGTHELDAGDSYYLAGNVPHGVETPEDTRVLDTFSPPRDEYIALDAAARQRQAL